MSLIFSYGSYIIAASSWEAFMAASESSPERNDILENFLNVSEDLCTLMRIYISHKPDLLGPI